MQLPYALPRRAWEREKKPLLLRASAVKYFFYKYKLNINHDKKYYPQF
jgi:hypothetical protein